MGVGVGVGAGAGAWECAWVSEVEDVGIWWWMVSGRVSRSGGPCPMALGGLSLSRNGEGSGPPTTTEEICGTAVVCNV